MPPIFHFTKADSFQREGCESEKNMTGVITRKSNRSSVPPLADGSKPPDSCKLIAPGHLHSRTFDRMPNSEKIRQFPLIFLCRNCRYLSEGVPSGPRLDAAFHFEADVQQVNRRRPCML